MLVKYIMHLIHIYSNLYHRFKDEFGGLCILHFCGLRSKCYSMVTETEQKMAAAGVKLSQQKLLKHHLFVERISGSDIFHIEHKNFVSKDHELYTQKTYRTALSNLDIKRIVLPDGINTVPYGYV